MQSCGHAVMQSCGGEVKNMYYIGEDQDYISCDTSLDRRNLCQKIINGASSLMKYLKSSK